ncbi:tyrosine-type recombinase/integrase [Gordonia jacobaea]|uniref:tyrosine-type recombinase/integrase n=1 Tax=Gordonia jacobaea TaxID=122202 RepID=UPI003D742C38
MTTTERRATARTQGRRPARADVTAGWSRPIQRWANECRTAGCAETTIRTRATCLRNLARTLQADVPDPAAVTTTQLRRYLDDRTWQPSTYRNNAKAIRAFYRWLHSSGVTAVDPALTLPVAINGHVADEMRARALARPDRPLTGPDPLPVPTEWAMWIEDFRRYMRAGGRTEHSVRTRLEHLKALARALDPLVPSEVVLDDLIDYLAERDDWKPETRRNIRGSLRAFYEWAVEADGRLTINPAQRLPRVKPGRPAPRPAPENVYVDALSGADERTRLMLRLSAELGMRRAEVACVHSRDITRGDGGHWWIVVHGKGRKDRVLPLTNDLAAAVRALAASGYLFPGLDGRGHLSARYVGELVRRRLPAGVTMHQLRHRFATQAYAHSRDLLTVQRLLGHSSPATTQRYIAADDSAMRRIVEAVATAGDRR